jgi:hypothetical protein
MTGMVTWGPVMLMIYDADESFLTSRKVRVVPRIGETVSWRDGTLYKVTEVRHLLGQDEYAGPSDTIFITVRPYRPRGKKKGVESAER